MRLLTNPLFVRAVAVFVCALATFVIAVLAMRRLRRNIEAEGKLSDAAGAADTLPLQAYTVIQQLKQQKFALQNEQQQQRKRTKTSEQITASIISNLPVGMLFIAPNGLVRQANTAARRILGFASPLGMSVNDIFRESQTFSDGGEEIKVRDVIRGALENKWHDESFECRYITPGGNQSQLKMTLIPVRVAEGELLGLAAVVADHAEAAAFREAQLVRAEESAEMALHVRNSLMTIREWAQQVKTAGSGSASGLADDISAEATRLEKVLGQFVAGTEKVRGAHA